MVYSFCTFSHLSDRCDNVKNEETITSISNSITNHGRFFSSYYESKHTEVFTTNYFQVITILPFRILISKRFKIPSFLFSKKIKIPVFRCVMLRKSWNRLKSTTAPTTIEAAKTTTAPLPKTTTKLTPTTTRPVPVVSGTNSFMTV